jgi:hypothetical protein
MIGEGRFQTQLSTVERILKHADLFEERQAFPVKGLGAAFFRGKSYREVYSNCISEFVYDFRLADQSLLLFEKGGSNEHEGTLSYTFYECPVEVMPYGDFVAGQLDIDATNEDFTSILAEWGDDLRIDYDRYVNSSDSKALVTPMRYDYVAAHYKCRIHPASHMHFGFLNQIRIGTRRIMNPISFALFVIRQRYPANWVRLLATRWGKTWCRNIREHLALVHANYWSPEDESDETFLS